ncbi:putative F-box domain-containing protein [Helianthus annuus]|uniref:F-box domain-containing protein n=1 Tax=Helianthus annuus TaxID=4232 RepID=A0A251VG13_HELAN|nr:putative F-box domain-containing protein [Helianthus annuus]KAJ0633546.1 putative F-box domain-containing protein [Helianthus annuus]KAJ0637359.1 putative F-box domain-containing protein [Helianthus annuus]KAJ0814685.1 putative F-box domain-containing protein [Helianthus annuus]
MKTLPVKSLLQFRTVSKAWKSLIDSPRFIARYSSQRHHLLVSYNDESHRSKKKFVSLVDDETFPQKKVSLTLPQCVAMLLTPTIIGTSHGLFCLYGDRHLLVPRGGKAVIWNPSIRKAVVVHVSTDPKIVEISRTVVGFGVCRETTDPKIVNIRHGTNVLGLRCVQVEVFTVSTGAWRTPYSSNLPRTSVYVNEESVVVIYGVLYWLATDKITKDGGSRYNQLIVSFDMTSEEFKEINLPDSLAYRFPMSINELRGSLVVLERGVDASNPIFRVWRMEEGAPNSFAKLLTFSRHTLD